MNLPSVKIQNKKQKHSSAGSNEFEERADFISKLPDALLTHILSLLPEADANQTRILSNRWKNLWAFLPNLRLVMPYCWSIKQVKKFHDSVDQTLALRGGMPIERFYLYCSKNCDYNRVYDSLCVAVECKVQDIELRFPADGFKVRFCWNLFRTCNTLVGLTLKGQFMLDVPQAQLLFPCLKRLQLVSILYSGEQSLTNLISACPVLEELFAERQVIGRTDNLVRFRVSSSSLKRLKISFALCVLEDYKVVIEAPNLEYMYILDVMSRHYSLTKPLSLVEAHVKTRPDCNTESTVEFFTSLSSVKILTLTDSCLMALGFVGRLNMPLFPNLVKFVIGIDSLWGWNLLAALFQSMPNLEHITFSDGLVPFPRAQHVFEIGWNPPVEVPDCLRYKMKEIIILNEEAITQEEFPLIKYLLKHSCHLERLSINAHKISHGYREVLLKFPRVSTSCQIELI